MKDENTANLVGDERRLPMTKQNVVIRGTNDKPVASGILGDYFEDDERAPSGGELFLGYPITSFVDGRRPIDAVYVSPVRGVVVFDLVEGQNIGDFEERQDDAATRLEIKLKQHSELVRKRALRIEIHAATFAPAVSRPEQLSRDGYPVVTESNLGEFFETLTWEGHDEDTYRRTISALQSISGIRRSPTVRTSSESEARSIILRHLENSIATLDAQQSRAVIETASDVQRIRGLAGSGKTIVLALKAAYLHAQHPDWRIGVTFNTRSLRQQFRRHINNFTIEQTGEEPDWNHVSVLPSWGAPGGGIRDGVYHRFCVENEVPYRDFRRARLEFGSQDALQGACAAALSEANQVKHSFDVLLVDEAQDLPPEFLRLCYEMLGEDKRLVYAYDELQTLNGLGLPPAEEIFGISPGGQPRVKFDDPSDVGSRDIILRKCYRNSRPLLVTAHALGFGIYRQPPPRATTGLVQMFEQKSLWNDIGYSVRDGDLEDGHRVVLTRDEDSSPKFLETHSAVDDLIVFKSFPSAAAQTEWIASAIQQNLSRDGLVENDIIVINPDPLTTRDNVGRIRKSLFDLGIQSHLAGVDTSADVFFKPEESSVTFTGVYRAKGNEAGMVYVINAHESVSSVANLARVRNRLFTAITRSKAWVRVTGIGMEMNALISEFEAAKSRDFVLDFVYPTKAERATLQILHRDVSRATEDRVRKYERSLSELLTDMEDGEVYPDDLDPETIERLRLLFGND
jgi:superfamily I DNA and RNA helicase